MLTRRTYEPLKFLGRLMFVPLPVEPKTSAVSLTTTWEPADAQRWAPTLVVRIPFTYYAIGVGWWLDSRDQDQIIITDEAEFEADYAAFEVINGPTDRERFQIIRDRVAEQGLDPSEEMEVMQMLNVMTAIEPDPNICEHCGCTLDEDGVCWWC